MGDSLVAGDGEARLAAEGGGRGRGGGRKRTRAGVQARPPPPPRRKKEEEDVCFICFDGGSLVLCDRRGCPKAYHTTCIKRDEAFFKSKARWNCGWHICSSCQKAAHFMCYTCTYSLCKGCTKDADYLCVRGNKGFCSTCLRIILLIENNEQGNKETAQVDFDDKSSWEYLFKVYWIYLKEKISLTSNELIRAKNRWKGVGTMAFKQQASNSLSGANDGNVSILDNSFVCNETNGSKRIKTEEYSEFLGKNTLRTGMLDSKELITTNGCTEWASKELLEFVAHMKNGDTSVLSQFSVQALLLEYIKKNGLRDPCHESQIICDMRLSNLFKKSFVDYFEMLKLLEFHFHMKEGFQKDAGKPIIQGSTADAVANQVDAESNNGSILMMGKDQICRPHKEGEETEPQSSVDEYAAIDIHNVNLVYVHRNLMETLIEDQENFHDKVVGSIVRLRISDQKQDLHRLVQVVGTCKRAVPHQLGEKTTDVMLEIVNLEKKETVSIDAISNEEFSEDECRHFQQHVRCGLVKWFTVGGIQEKTMALQAPRFNNWLEKERLRSNHLCVQEIEKGHKKEFRETIENSQLLKTPEGPRRRVHEIPQVHEDPYYFSKEDAGELNAEGKDACVMSYCGFRRKGRASVSPQKGDDISNNTGGKGLKILMNCAQSRNTFTTIYPDKESHTLDTRKDSCGSNTLEKPGDQVDSAGSVIGDRNSHAVLRPGSNSGVASGIAGAPLFNGFSPSVSNSEREKLWHYRDPTGVIQGPFSMVQLREWRISEYFRAGVRISDLNVKPDVSSHSCDERWVGSVNTVIIDNKQSEGSCNSNNAKSHASDIKETMSTTCCSHLQTGNSSQCWDSSECANLSSDLPQVRSQLFPSTMSGHLQGNLIHQGRDLEDNKYNSGPNNGNLSHGTPVFQTMGGQSDENRPNSWGHPGQSSGQNWKPSLGNFSSTHRNPSSNLASVAKSTDSSEQLREIEFVELPSCTQKPIDENWDRHAADSKQSVSSNVLDRESHIQDLPSVAEKSSSGNKKGRATMNKPFVSSNFLDQDSGPSWSSASSLVAGSGAHLPETADEWDGCSPTPPKSSIEDLDSSVVSVSSLKPAEVLGDHAATPTSKIEQLAYSPPSIAEPIEISTLAEESVSDLLAEVDAMESQYGFPSPTSKLNCGGELIQNSKDGCFNLMELLSPCDPGKSNPLHHTRDTRLPSQSTMTDVKLGASQDDVFDTVKRSDGHSSTSAQGEGETWFDDIPVKYRNAASSIQPLAPSAMKHNILESDTAQTAGSEALDTGWGTTKMNMDLNWLGSDQGIMKMDWGTSLGTPRGNSIMDWVASVGNIGQENQPKFSEMGFTGPGDSAGGGLGF